MTHEPTQGDNLKNVSEIDLRETFSDQQQSLPRRTKLFPNNISSTSVVQHNRFKMLLCAFLSSSSIS